ncbi:hypothetical protein AHAS_Ahas06G0160000 [Arachis hypogaea]
MKIYGRGTPGVGRGMLVQVSREKCYSHKRGVARQDGRGTPAPSTTMGVPLETWGVACQFINPKVQALGHATWYRRRGTPSFHYHLDVPLEKAGVASIKRAIITWACHLSSTAWHASPQPSLGRATLDRRRSTPGSHPHLGMPFECQGMARHPSLIIWACHLDVGRGMPAPGMRRNYGRGTLDLGRGTLVIFSREEAWHASINHQQEDDMGVPLEFWAWLTNEGTNTYKGHGTPDPGRATLVQLSRMKKRRTKAWACHLGSKAWNAILTKAQQKPGRATWARRRGTPS